MNKTKGGCRQLLRKTGAGVLTAALMISLFGSMGVVTANADTGDIGVSEAFQAGDLSDAAVLEEDSLTMALDSGDAITKTVPEGFELSNADESADLLFAFAGGTEESGTTWSLSDSGVLTISGSGSMTDYTSSNYPEWYTYRSQITSVVVKEGITDLGNMAFYNCTKLTTVSLPDSLQSMGRTTFADCTSLKSINIPSSVTELEYAVFANCTSLTSVSLNSIQTIGSYVFQGTTISEMVIPASVTSMDALAFFDSDIEKFSVSANNSVYSAQDGVLYTDSGATLFAYPQGNSAETFTVPDGVVTIGETAFAYTKNLKTINFPTSVKSFKDSAFQNAYAIKSFKIPDSVTEVGMFTFYGCPALTSVTFGSGLTVTGYQMFYDCSALTNIDFGNSLSELDAHTFAYCTSLTEVTLPANIKTIGNACFGCCSSLISFTAKGLEGTIPYQSFYGCTSLTNVSLNEGVTQISRVAFYGCDRLTEITLPASMEFVYFNAFPTSTVITNKNTELRSYGANGYRYLEDVSISGSYNYDMAYQVLDLVNEERVAAGLSALLMDESLLETAMQRGSEIALLFAHTRPDGSTCFSANSAMYGENVAAGQASASAVMNSWMNSEGHRENILTESYTTVGIGCFYHNGMYYWVQCFGEGDAVTNCNKPDNENVTKTISLAVGTFETPISSTGVYWGDVESYTYGYSMSLDTSLKDGETSQARVYVQNPGFSSASALLNNNGITFTSSNTDVAAVSQNGLVSALSTGYAVIAASLDYSIVRKTVSVNGGVSGADTLVVRRDGNVYYFSNSISDPDAGVTKVSYGRASDEVLVGDWDGDGIDTLAVRRGNVYYFSNSISNPNAAVTVVSYGRATDTILVGDWNGDGIDTLAVRRDGNIYYFSNSISNPNSAVTKVSYGREADEVLVGDWSGDGIDTLAVRRDGNIYYFSNSISNPNAAVTKVSYGRKADTVLVGDWDGDEIDTLAVRRDGNVYYFSNSISNPNAAVTKVSYGRAADDVYVGTWN